MEKLVIAKIALQCIVTKRKERMEKLANKVP
jgi:hypothetical protein